jgi:transposase InsO family protein
MDNYNIKRSMSRVGTPTDNAIIESINGWIKAEIYLDFKPSTYDSIEDFFKEYILYFIYIRPSSKLKYKSPAQYTNEQGLACCF